MAKFSLANFVEAAGAVALGQMTGKAQGEALLRQRQEEQFQQQLQALNLRRQLEQQQYERATVGPELLLKNLGLVSPEARGQAAGAAMGQIGAAGKAPFAGVGIPTEQIPPYMRGILGPSPLPAPAAPPPVTFQEPAQIATAQALRSVANFLPGGALMAEGVLRAPPAQAAQALGVPPTPTFTVPGIGEFPAAVGPSKEDLAAYKSSLDRTTKAMGRVPYGSPLHATMQPLWGKVTALPRTQEELSEGLSAMQQILATAPPEAAVQAQTGQAALAEEKALREQMPKELRALNLTEATLGLNLATIGNYLERETALNKSQQERGQPPLSVRLSSVRPKFVAAQAAWSQGNVAEALRLTGELKDLLSSERLTPEQQVKNLTAFFQSTKTWSPEQLANREWVEKQADNHFVGNQVRNMLRLGFSFAAGPAEKAVLEGLAKAKSLAQFGPEATQLLLDRIIPMARLTNTPIPINAKLVQQMNPAQLDAAARGWKSLRLAGDRRDIARGHLLLALSMVNRAWQDTDLKMQRVGKENPAAALQALKTRLTDTSKAFDKALDDSGYRLLFNPKEKPEDDIAKGLLELWKKKQAAQAAVDQFTRKRLNVNPETGEPLAPTVTMTPQGQLGFTFPPGGGRPSGPPLRPEDVPGLRGAGRAPTTPTAAPVRRSAAPGDARARLAAVNARIRALKARQGR